MESWTSRCVTWSVRRTKAIEMHKEGTESAVIADRLSVSPQAVMSWIRAEGFEPIFVKSRRKTKDRAKKGRFAHLR